MSEEELIYVLALQNVPKVGSINAKKLIAHCGSAKSVFREPPKKITKIDGIGQYLVNGLNESLHVAAAQQELKFIKANGIDVHYFLESSYPENLKHCIDSPVLLFSRGKINLENKHIISIVGARKATTYGKGFCNHLIEVLAPYNPVIISGFAYGIDIAAQKAALDHNLQTIGCLAHGLNQIYPKVHEKYMLDIEQHGGFFTDFWSSDNFDRNNFLKRNRIIAGLSQATLVIESAEKGGSLVTADIANSYDREVFALPGRHNDKQSEGCNNLIKYQKAHMLSNPLDIPYLLNWTLDKQSKPAIQKSLFVDLESDEKEVFAIMSQQPKCHLDELSISTGFPTYRLASILLNMELKGVVRPLPGKLFELC